MFYMSESVNSVFEDVAVCDGMDFFEVLEFIVEGEIIIAFKAFVILVWFKSNFFRVYSSTERC